MFRHFNMIAITSVLALSILLCPGVIRTAIAAAQNCAGNSYCSPPSSFSQSGAVGLKREKLAANADESKSYLPPPSLRQGGPAAPKSREAAREARPPQPRPSSVRRKARAIYASGKTRRDGQWRNDDPIGRGLAAIFGF
jgi:hypothetical protein